MINQTDLELLMFAHPGACENPVEEIERLRMLEKDRRSPGNFVLYLGKKNDKRVEGVGGESVIMLNPCLVSAVNRFKPGTLHIHARIGIENPPLTYRDRIFLRKFISPVLSGTLSGDEVKLACCLQTSSFSGRIPALIDNLSHTV